MYLDYWQLTTRPFEPAADRAAFYPCEAQEAALLKLRYAVENRRGAALLAGPAGVGKTMLVQLFRSELADTFRPQVHLVFPQMSSRDLLVYLAEQLGAPPADPPRHTIEESVRRLEFLLRQNAKQGRHAVVVVDEAHLLEDCGALETLRLLLELRRRRPADAHAAAGRPDGPGLGGRPAAEPRGADRREDAGALVHRGGNGRLRPPPAEGGRRDARNLHADAHRSAALPGPRHARQINRLGDLALLVGFADRLPRLTAQQIEAVSEELVTIAAD